MRVSSGMVSLFSDYNIIMYNIFMLYLMRHGRTDWNVRHKLQGRTDIPLNEEGRQMARDAHDEYLDTHFDICYCSPLIRAVETAEILLEGRNVPIVKDDRLLEMCFGDYEGIEHSFKIPDCPINVIFQDPASYKESVGGAETIEELNARTKSFLDELVYPKIAEGKDVLIVGHGAMNCSLISNVKNLPREDFWSWGLAQCKLMTLM
jgi:probable phosphoglycerate mutase